ncbi:hypothetical protein [Knoellia aerolata]|uniref:Glycosyl transferase family 1 domain-containing protein n=1 Tax=Knoellia aerolata DSM 18566 TaxID=1385519 RepID=A0A0A0JXV8_9MICO|nr:hypothetical protein [Knoellia aerolata]KGN40907.1 hypothetical protein N801_10625 [Knoellia aerolata DSM 18566]
MGASAQPRRIARAVKRRLPRPVKAAAKKGVNALTAGPVAVREEVRKAKEAKALRAEFCGSELPPRAQAPVRVLVAPANFAGQGEQWAESARRFIPGVAAHSFAVLNGKFDFPVSYSASRNQAATEAWQRAHFDHVVRTYTHVLIEAERPLFGSLFGPEASTEIGPLREHGLRVGLIAHGSDVRIPSHHAELYEWSPFRETDWEIVPTLQYNATRNAALLNGFDGPVLVSTPDLLDDVPGARWCPVVVDAARWHSATEPMRRARPIVAHAPSSSRMKGSDLIDPVVQRLADEGLVDYRRIHDVPPSKMPEVYRTADIVLDQFRLGSYGVAACEGMAASRIVVGHVAPSVRRRVFMATGLELPIVEATPDSLEEVLRDLVRAPDDAAATARAARDFVVAVHSGRLSADALTPLLAQV